MEALLQGYAHTQLWRPLDGWRRLHYRQFTSQHREDGHMCRLQSTSEADERPDTCSDSRGPLMATQKCGSQRGREEKERARENKRRLEGWRERGHGRAREREGERMRGRESALQPIYFLFGKGTIGLGRHTKDVFLGADRHRHHNKHDTLHDSISQRTRLQQVQDAERRAELQSWRPG